PHLPVTPQLVHVALVVAIVASVTATLGFLTRTSALVFVLSAGYYLTVPQLFGKVIHYHVVVWVALVLVAARSSDVLSLDAVVRAWRRPDQHLQSPPAARRYSAPLRVIWLVMGGIYLLPGLYKYGSTGLEWASPHNMRGIMYGKWFELGGWHPFFDAAGPGPLLVLWGLGTMAFELTFILLVLDHRTRRVAAGLGLVFHNMTWLVLRIPFLWLQVLYLSFVNWQWLADRAALSRGLLTFRFDAQCRMCRRAVAVLNAVTLPGLVVYLAVDGGPDTVTARLHERSAEGFGAYRLLAWRVPVLWPALPVLYLRPVVRLGNRVYAAVSARRVCSVERLPEPAPVSVSSGHRAPALVGATLLAGMLWAASVHAETAWPMAIYPTFAGDHAWVRPVIEVVGVDPAGRRRRVDLRRLMPWVPPDRVRAQVDVISDQDEPQRSRAVLAVVAGEPALRGWSHLRLVASTVSDAPGHVGQVISSTVLAGS
ncbi:MAG: HTTM domain-containing protein, partial [Sporichthyaceae bacterium]